MNSWHLSLLVCFAFFASIVNSAVIPNDGDVDSEGLYSKSDGVLILTKNNFDRHVYGKKRGLVVQFYNSYCGHCRAFSPKYKALAGDIQHWRSVLQLGVVDCSVEDNNGLCRQFEILAYPSLRYFHENYIKANTNLGEQMNSIDTSDKLKGEIIYKLQTEQSMGRLRAAPPLGIASYTSYAAALTDIPQHISYIFLVFETENSTVGSELALDVIDYNKVRVKRVNQFSELTSIAGVTHFPGLVEVRPDLQATSLTPKNPTVANLLSAINTFLSFQNYEFPVREKNSNDNRQEENIGTHVTYDSDAVYYSDLEKTIKTFIHTEVPRYKKLTGEPLQALFNILDVLISSFPFRGNLQAYIQDLRTSLATKSEWSGDEVQNLVKRLENYHSPVYPTNLEYIGCRGSQPQYRGYTCGLWTLFHILTVNAALKPGKEGPKVLRALHGYAKHFFGCTECSEHFQAMAARNKLFDVKENDKAILWLWISHNEVNLRLAGDLTEDPEHPKVQFPRVEKCRECRLARGAWNLPAVYQYLKTIYGPANIRDAARISSLAAPSPLSNLDIGMLSLLYILSFILLILAVKYFLTKHFYRKRAYRHGRGKVFVINQ